jgi:hypothetical protein
MPIAVITIIGRTLLALLFILAGAAKMQAHNLSWIIWPLTIFRACCCRWSFCWN